VGFRLPWGLAGLVPWNVLPPPKPPEPEPDPRAIGQLGGTIPYNVWVRAGRVLEAAPNLPLVDVSV